MYDYANSGVFAEYCERASAATATTRGVDECAKDLIPLGNAIDQEDVADLAVHTWLSLGETTPEKDPG